MSWSITGSGTKEQVAESIDRQVNDLGTSQESQKNTVVSVAAFVKNVVGMSPEGSHVVLSANGHVDDSGHQTINLTLGVHAGRLGS